MDFKRTEVIFKALSDENRLKILELLKEGERCGCNLLQEMQITQSTLSHHMKILCESSLVGVRREGKRMYYSISDEGMEKGKEIFEYYLNHSNNVIEEFCEGSLDEIWEVEK